MRHTHPRRSFRTSHWNGALEFDPTTIIADGPLLVTQTPAEETHRAEIADRDRLVGMAIASALGFLIVLALTQGKHLPAQFLEVARQPYDLASQVWISLSKVDWSYGLRRSF